MGVGSAGTKDPKEEEECEEAGLGVLPWRAQGQARESLEETDTLGLTNGVP